MDRANPDPDLGQEEEEGDLEDERTPSAATERLAAALGGARTYIQTLPAFERHVASLAADSVPLWQIAQETRTSEGAIARILDSVVAAVTGREIEPVETGGFGSDTDPGVTGGYDNAGFGALDNDPPLNDRGQDEE
ncbi:MAG: hypothetical protein H0T49_06770 [Chloroflexia bacterium]|jgi:hypothetical protein|nr:hypothetical protein [Chloroflexia bacterium]